MMLLLMYLHDVPTKGKGGNALYLAPGCDGAGRYANFTGFLKICPYLPGYFAVYLIPSFIQDLNDHKPHKQLTR